MSSVLDMLVEKVERLTAGGEHLARQVRKLRRSQAATEGSLASHIAAGSTLLEPLTGGSDLVRLRITEAVEGTDYEWLAERIRPRDVVGGFELEEDDPDPFRVIPSPDQAALFVGARVWAVHSHNVFDGPTGVAYYEAIAGEGAGFLVKLTTQASPFDGSAYEWEQVGVRPEMRLMSSGAYGLGAAVLLGSLAWDPQITAARHDFDTGVRAWIRWSADLEKFWFSGAPDPTYGLCFPP